MIDLTTDNLGPEDVVRGFLLAMAQGWRPCGYTVHRGLVETCELMWAQ
jgi:hypothetical protein